MSEITLLWLSNWLMIEASKIVVDILVCKRNQKTVVLLYLGIMLRLFLFTILSSVRLRITSTIKLYSASCKRTC